MTTSYTDQDYAAAFSKAYWSEGPVDDPYGPEKADSPRRQRAHAAAAAAMEAKGGDENAAR